MIKDLSTVYDQSVPGHYETDEYVFFWSGPFSNWHPSEFKLTAFAQNFHFVCAEQAMMVYKALLFEDHDSARRIMKTENPSEQKKLGRKVKAFDPAIWDEYKMEFTHTFLCNKFYQNSDLRKILDDTGNKILVEASPYDDIWGIGMGVDKYPQILDQSNWRGENLLGKALMEVRSELRRYGKYHPELEMELATMRMGEEIMKEIDTQIINDVLRLLDEEDDVSD